MEYDGPVPRHIAVIMDGNGRWARARDLPREKGHEAGAESVRQIVRDCARLGVEVLTLYSFSTENWRRPETEVQALMTLLETYLREEAQELLDNEVRLMSIGQTERLPAKVRAGLGAVQKLTEPNKGLKLVLALSYGGRAELVGAIRAIVREGTPADAIDEDTVAAHLGTAGLPDPDLMIRTSGELRISNFLLWQLAYAEFYVTDVLWPDFRTPHLLEALRVYGTRERRFGQTPTQIGTP